MYKYAATDSIFDGISNIYLVSIATAFLAVIVAFYCSNLLKDESDKQLKSMLNEVGEDSEEESLNFMNNTVTEIDNGHELTNVQHEYVRRNEFLSTSDSDDNGIECRKDEQCSTYDSSDIDEMYVDGLVSKLKSKRVKDLESQLTTDQLDEERRIEREQLAAIFELLKKQEAQLNMKEINESELNAQLALYR